MRERRWELASPIEFEDLFGVSRRLQGLGFRVVEPDQDLICYVEEWRVDAPEDIHRLGEWPVEDVTLVGTSTNWNGDFYLLAGAYHTAYRSHQRSDTYCSVSHPWQMAKPMQTHHPQAMFWVGFRGEQHAFIRVRLDTIEIVAPGETRADHQRSLWTTERRDAFLTAIEALDIPLTPSVEKGKVTLHALDSEAALFCSWPDAFGPCQFEYNVADPFQFLLPATQLANTSAQSSPTVRTYMTGFLPEALHEFWDVQSTVQHAYRCCVHCQIGDLPDIGRMIQPAGKLYATISEFQTQDLLPHGNDAWAIVGIVAFEERFKIEVRLNRAPLPEADMLPWLETLIGCPMVYAPLPPFP
ncbi:MAG TPA: hypothetical protein EYN18_01795 [Nitrospirales bacterium]|nr:hypothetical protein [Nitrospirales bacterium]